MEDRQEPRRVGDRCVLVLFRYIFGVFADRCAGFVVMFGFLKVQKEEGGYSS